MKLNRFAKFAWTVLVLNLFVILWGAFVRASGSGAGCGSHWPLCNGEIIPLAPRIQTIVEFVHRISSGTAFIFVIVMVVWAWRAYPAGHRVRKGAVACLSGMIAESLAGAGLVLFQWTALDVSFGRIIIMPVHLIITFTLLAALSLTAWWASGGANVQVQGTNAWLLGIGLLATLLMGMAGAVTALGDTVLPVASLTPGVYANLPTSAEVLVGLRVWHPFIAIAVAMYILFVLNKLRESHSHPFVARLSMVLVALFVVELGAGVVNIWLAVPIWMQLTHLLLANLTWITMILLSAATLQET